MRGFGTERCEIGGCDVNWCEVVECTCWCDEKCVNNNNNNSRKLLSHLPTRLSCVERLLCTCSKYHLA